MYETEIVGKTEAGIPIFKITWFDGPWWELLSIRTYGTAQAVRQASLGFDTSVDVEALKQREGMNIAALNGSTVRWSWDAPVTDDFIRSLPDDVGRVATRELADRHLARMLQTDDDKKKVSKWHSFWTNLFRFTGRMSPITRRQ